MKRRYLQLSLTVCALFSGLAFGQVTPNASHVYPLNLPAGASLISSPVNTGPGLGVDAFIGLPPGDPLFYGWSSDTQSWVPSDQAPAGLGHGFWLYSQTPVTLLVKGQPYSFLTSMTKHISPGWHLFGVPFESGIQWNDFKLYASGSPISLSTAIEMGWIDQDITSTQGSQSSVLAPGQPFQPGQAYWIHTTVALDVRADATVAAAANTSATAFDKTAEPKLEKLETRAAVTATGSSADQNAMSWLAQISETLAEVCKGAAAFAEDNWVAGIGDSMSGGFGLLEKALDPGAPDMSAQLTQVDTKLNILITDVTAVSDEVDTVEKQVAGLSGFTVSNAVLGQPLANAKVWLQANYTDSYNAPSREWARRVLAGCTATTIDCPEESNPVSAAKLATFKGIYVTAPGTATQYGDFPLWWAEQVLGGYTPAIFTDGGESALNYLNLIYTGITSGLVTSSSNPNGLVAYMHTVLATTPCASDVTASTCDLYGQVYKPVEAFFLQAMGDQAQLMAARVEAYGVLRKQGLGQNTDAQRFMTGMVQNINLETEAFLRVAELIALYRAADGVTGWASFASSDAGQLLGRADFVVAGLAGQYYQTAPQQGYSNPPWPSQGVVGRVFYANGETPLASGAGRALCVVGVVCPTPSKQLYEQTLTGPVTDPRYISGGAVTGEWPYFTYQNLNGVAVGTPQFQWTVRRLAPLAANAVSNGSYVVDSTSTLRGSAGLTVATYDPTTSVSVPAGTSGAVQFGSFSSVEGTLGLLAFGANNVKWTSKAVVNYTKDNEPAVYYLPQAWGPSPVTLALKVAYQTTGSSKSATNNINATLSAPFQITMPPGFTKVKTSWLSFANAALTTVKATSGNPTAVQQPFWQSLSISQQLVDSTGNPVGAQVSSTPCGTKAFDSCTATVTLDLGSDPFAISSGSYSWVARYIDHIEEDQTITSPTSTFTWTLANPVLTIAK